MSVKFELTCTVVTIIIIEQCNLNYQVMEALDLMGKYGITNLMNHGSDS